MSGGGSAHGTPLYGSPEPVWGAVRGGTERPCLAPVASWGSPRPWSSPSPRRPSRARRPPAAAPTGPAPFPTQPSTRRARPSASWARPTRVSAQVRLAGPPAHRHPHHHTVTPTGDPSQNLTTVRMVQDRLRGTVSARVTLGAAPTEATDAPLVVGFGKVVTDESGPYCQETAGSVIGPSHTYGTSGAYDGARPRLRSRPARSQDAGLELRVRCRLLPRRRRPDRRGPRRRDHRPAQGEAAEAGAEDHDQGQEARPSRLHQGADHDPQQRPDDRQGAQRPAQLEDRGVPRSGRTRRWARSSPAPRRRATSTCARPAVAPPRSPSRSGPRTTGARSSVKVRPV